MHRFTGEIKEIADSAVKASIAAEILADLPEWFGLPESTAGYITESGKLPFWAAFAGDKAVGFIVLKETSPHTAEIYVTGVKRAYHGNGIGRALCETFSARAKKRGCTFLQVKTVKEGCYDTYDQTNAFYKRMGFVEFECFPSLWDEWNPCQVLVRYVGE